MWPMIYLLRSTRGVILWKRTALRVGFDRVYDQHGCTVIFSIPTIYYIFFTPIIDFHEVYENEKYTTKNCNNYYNRSKKFYPLNGVEHEFHGMYIIVLKQQSGVTTAKKFII